MATSVTDFTKQYLADDPNKSLTTSQFNAEYSKVAGEAVSDAENQARLAEFMTARSEARKLVPKPTVQPTQTQPTQTTQTQPTDTKATTPQTEVERLTQEAQKSEADNRLRLETEIDTYTQRFDALNEATKAQNASLINSIKATYANRINQMQLVNKGALGAKTTAGIRSGRARYASDLQTDILSSEEKDGIKRITELDAEMHSLINQAQSAATEKEFARLNEKMTTINGLREKQNQAIQNQLKLAQDFEDRAIAKAKATSEMEKTQQEVLEGNLDLYSSALIGYDEAGNLQVGSDEEMNAFAEQLGVPVALLKTRVQSQISELSKLSQEEYKRELDIKNAERQLIPAAFQEYEYATKNLGYTGDFFEYLAQKDLSEMSPLDIKIKQLQIEKLKQEIQTNGINTVGGPEELARTIMTPGSGFSLTDIPTSDGQRAAVAQELNKLKQEALQSGNIFGVMQASAGGKDADATTVTSFEKAFNVVGQIADLQNTFERDDSLDTWKNQIKKDTGFDLSPAIKALRKFNPWDLEAQEISAQLQSIIPTLARGIYGEVGVLTDQDIENYKKTLPNLGSTEEVRDAVLGMTIRSIQRSIENKVKTQAALGRDMSGLSDIYKQVQTQADALLGIKPVESYKSVDEFLSSPSASIDQKKQLESMIQNNPDITDPNDIWEFYLEEQGFKQPLSMGVKSSDVSKITDGSKVVTTMGAGTATGIQNGSSKWKYGFDFVLAGGKGASVPAPFNGTVIFAGMNKGFGNQVKIRMADGREIWLSHLDALNVKPGQKIVKGMTIGKQGNTGALLSGSGQELTPQQIASGRGTHLDITIKKPGGGYLSSKEVASLLGTRIS